MSPNPGRARARGGRSDRTVRHTIIALLVTALLAFAAVATGTAIVARQIARRDALAEALRSARLVGSTVFAPLLPAVILGDRGAIDRLDDAVRLRWRDGSLVRVKIWKRDGTIIYSDDAAAIGAKFPLHTDVAETIDLHKSTAALSNLTDPENVTETARWHRLVEVYLPLNLDDGTTVAFEMYSSDARVVTAETQLSSQLIPFALAALLILLITQLPVSIWLVRRVGRARDEHTRLLDSALTASGRERRAIARDLHDGVVQDLAGASYAIDALPGTLPLDTGRQSQDLIESVAGVLKSSVGALRTLMVDIYPPDLSADGLQAAITDLAATLHARTGVHVEVHVEIETQPSPEVAATVYRCARECLINIATHARAQHARVHLTGDQTVVRLRITDDGIGLAAAGTDRRGEGHFGLRLLKDAAADLGGALRVSSGTQGGTTVELDLPTSGIGLVGRSR